MQRVKAAVWIVVFIAIICVVSHTTVHSVTDTLQTHLSVINNAAKAEQYTSAGAQADAMTEYLKSHQHWLELFIKRETIASIAVNLHGISAYANAECVNDLLNEIDKATQQVEMLRHLFFSIF